MGPDIIDIQKIKSCVRCKATYEIESDGFHKGKKGKYKTVCKFCINETQRRAALERKETEKIDERAKYGWKWGE